MYVRGWTRAVCCNKGSHFCFMYVIRKCYFLEILTLGKNFRDSIILAEIYFLLKVNFKFNYLQWMI